MGVVRVLAVISVAQKSDSRVHLVTLGFAVVVVGWLAHSDGRRQIEGKAKVGGSVLLVGFTVMLCGLV